MRYLSVALQYGIYLLEAGLLAYLTVRRRFGGLVCLILYLSLLLAFDGVSRPYILYRYGYSSREYAYFYWLTDVLLTLGAFLLVCAFFRRACKYEQKMWHSIRLVLVFVLILTLAISSRQSNRSSTVRGWSGWSCRQWSPSRRKASARLQASRRSVFVPLGACRSR